jgi:hypothetical protein
MTFFQRIARMLARQTQAQGRLGPILATVILRHVGLQRRL